MNRISSRIVCCYLYPITKYGYPPLAADTLRYIDEMADLGFASIELEGIRQKHLSEVYRLRWQIQEKLETRGLTVPYFCVVLPNLSSPNPQKSKESLEWFERGCELARILGAKGVIDNGPLLPFQFPADIPVTRHYHEESLQSATIPSHLDWKQFWNHLITTYRQACDIAANYDLTYQMHPAAGVLANSTDGFLLFAQSVDRPNLRFNFDTANLFAIKENLSMALIRLTGYIDYIHLSDNRGQRIEHLAIGKGSIHWENFWKTIESIGFEGDYGIDIGGAESTVENLDEAYRSAAGWLASRI